MSGIAKLLLIILLSLITHLVYVALVLAWSEGGSSISFIPFLARVHRSTVGTLLQIELLLTILVLVGLALALFRGESA